MFTDQHSENKYEIPKEDLYKLISIALGAVESDSIQHSGVDHKYLSQSWVKHFAIGLQEHYKRSGAEILSFYNQRDVSDVNTPQVKEFLYDITVAEYDTFSTSFSGHSIPFIKKPIWQIESEFEEDMREVAKDFQKLIAGNAPYKMMVIPLGRDNSKHYLSDMAHLAKHVNGDLYMLSITHPSKWSNSIEWRLYNWGYWQLIKKVKIK